MMRGGRYYISLYVIVPAIFAGVAILSMLVANNIIAYCMRRGLDPGTPMLVGALVLGVLTFICGLLIARILLNPLMQFAKKTEELGVVAKLPPVHAVSPQADEVGRFTHIFQQVTELLSQVDARELFPQITGQSRAMRGIFNQIMKVAPTDATVLIIGETGTGKELISKSIHDHSQRKDKPFVAINCAAIPEGLLESELFGHEKGAFTGATGRKPGKFEVADGGTLFLDEIGDMPKETQAKILRVLEEGEVERVGGIKSIKVNVRIVAATNKDLAKMVEAGQFRQDLYFRLNVFSILLPPLRDRREDIPLLVDRFVQQLDKKVQVSPEALQLLSAYRWPGNVRELKNTVEAASVLATDTIAPVHLPSTITKEWEASGKDQMELTDNHGLDRRLADIEKGIIIEALTRAGGVQVRAAKALGIKERSLWHRIKKYEIDVTSFKVQF